MQTTNAYDTNTGRAQNASLTLPDGSPLLQRDRPAALQDDQLAAWFASHANEERFEAHRGCSRVSSNRVVYFDSNPNANRPKVIGAIVDGRPRPRRAGVNRGSSAVGRAHGSGRQDPRAPGAGAEIEITGAADNDSGYTLAMVLRHDEGDLDSLESTIEDAVMSAVLGAVRDESVTLGVQG